jgi:hypothetical protein
MRKFIKCELPRKIRVGVGLLLILFGGTISFAQSAGGNFNKPESDLVKKQLKYNDLVAFQKRAVQKVQEHYQYLSVMAGIEHQSAVRDKAVEMAKKQFEKEALIWFNDKSESVDYYLDQCRKGTEYKEVDSLVVIHPFSELTDGEYRSSIWVQYVIRDSKANGKEKKQKKSSEQFSISLKRNEKVFGSNKKYVWELYLSSIASF